VETENAPQTLAALIAAGEKQAQASVERWTWEAGELLRRKLERRSQGGV
jgi:hypothetical protein